MSASVDVNSIGLGWGKAVTEVKQDRPQCLEISSSIIMEK